jgi:hypothetical protein
MPCPSHIPNNIRYKVPIMKLFIVQTIDSIVRDDMIHRLSSPTENLKGFIIPELNSEFEKVRGLKP